MQNFWHDFTTPLGETLVRILTFVPRLIVAAAIFFVFYILAGVARRLSRRSLEKVASVQWSVRILVARGLYLAILIIGLLLAFSAANLDVDAVLASLGVAGLAIGFAFKDILENFISGILLLFARPFAIGDEVTLGTYEGLVKDIQIRSTTLCTYNNEIVIIPNSSVYSNPVVNHTQLGSRRYCVAFDTSLSADTDAVRRILLNAVQSNPKISADPEPVVRIVNINSAQDAMSWELYYSADAFHRTEFETLSEIRERIKREIFDAGIPTPTSTTATILKRHPKPDQGAPPQQ